MQIVINISEESYKNIKEQVDKRDYPDMQIGRAIADGVLIPECHGKLVDIDLLRDQVSHDEREAFSKHQVWLLLSAHNKKIQTILEADEAYKNRLCISGVDPTISTADNFNNAMVNMEIRRMKNDN